MKQTLVVITALLAMVFTGVSAGATTHKRVGSPHSVVSSVSGTTATLSWTAATGHVTGYYVARDGRDSTGGGRYATVVASTRRSFTFTLLIPGSTYHLILAARDGSSQSTAVVRTVSIARPPKLTITTEVAAINSLQPYAADAANHHTDPYGCTLQYHEFAPTAGCGGATVRTHITGLASFPHGLESQGTLTTYADLARTFGCVDPAHHFRTVMVINQRQLRLTSVYATWEFYPLGSSSGATSQTSNNMIIGTYVNFTPVDFTCDLGEVRAQLGVKVSNLRAVVDDKVFGERVATFAGPWYSPPERF